MLLVYISSFCLSPFSILMNVCRQIRHAVQKKVRYAMLRYAMLRYAMLCYAMLCHSVVPSLRIMFFALLNDISILSYTNPFAAVSVIGALLDQCVGVLSDNVLASQKTLPTQSIAAALFTLGLFGCYGNGEHHLFISEI